MPSFEQSTNRRLRQAGTIAALVCILVSGGVFVRRGVSAWRAGHVAPGTAITSGCEEESIFALWRATHGQDVFTNPTRLPYSAAYFNWLFYAVYAQPTKVAVRSGGGPSIANVDRLVTAAGIVIGVFLLFWLIKRARPDAPAFAAGVATFVFFGPLVGWWAFTVRPDAWALAFETAAIVVLLCGYRERPRLATVGAALLFYLAWSFKQTYFTGLGGALLFLVVRRQWRLAITLAATSVALWVATFTLAGAGYRAALLDAGSAGMFQVAVGKANLIETATKTFPLWLLAAVAILQRPMRPAGDLQADMRLLGALGFAVAFPFAFVASCKVGASSNYYCSSILLLALLGAAVTTQERVGASVVPAALGLAALVQLLVVSGRVGVIDLMPQAREHAATWAAWRKEPEPRYSFHTVFNQPWLSERSPPIVLAFTYQVHRDAGHTFERGGLGGLINEGYFRSLMLPADTGTEYDQASLSRYSRGETVNDWTIFRRKEGE